MEDKACECHKVSNVSCDLIVHKRGKKGEHDNLIALEMKSIESIM